MNITIEQNKVIVNLDETEFPIFQTMFANLQAEKQVSLEFRKFPNFGGTFSWSFAPMHLCRVIGEANLSENPFATVSLYPFWKHGFAFGAEKALALNLAIDDPHKKAVAADEFGMGFTAWAMEEIFHCEFWADATAMIEEGFVVPIGAKCPDFVCGFPDGSLGIFEAKGTTGKISALTQALKTGKYQACSLDAESPIKYRVVIGAALGEPTTKVILMDPEPDDKPIPTNLDIKLVANAAKRMRLGGEFPSKKRGVAESDGVCIPAATETIFRGPRGATGPAREMKLIRTEYKEDKKHGWLSTEQ